MKAFRLALDLPKYLLYVIVLGSSYDPLVFSLECVDGSHVFAEDVVVGDDHIVVFFGGQGELMNCKHAKILAISCSPSWTFL